MMKVFNFKVYPDKDHLYKYPFFPNLFFVYYLGLKGMIELILDIRKPKKTRY